MSNLFIRIQDLRYTLPNAKSLFANLSLILNQQKIGLLGKNGVGKTTLLKFILNELQPSAGSVQVQGTLAYCPQQPNFADDCTIAEVLGIMQKLAALSRIFNGSSAEKDFDCVADDWEIASRAKQQLVEFGLSNFDLSTLIHQLSGGQRTRLLLAYGSRTEFRMGITGQSPPFGR